MLSYVYSNSEHRKHTNNHGGITSFYGAQFPVWWTWFSVFDLCLFRGALIKPWIFTEIKEGRHWDISSNERLDVLRDFSNFGLEHWGSDTRGVEKTRTFMLEWLSFMCRWATTRTSVYFSLLITQDIHDLPFDPETRIIILSPSLRYIPVGLLERVPQKINERPPYYLGRNYLESLMASQHVGDWIRIRWAGNTSAFKTKLHRITATLMYLLIIISFFSPLQWNATWTSTKEFHLLAQTQSQCLQMIFSFSQHPGFLMSLFLFDVENII